MFIKNPNLPDKKVNAVLIDYRAEKAAAALRKLGIEVFVTPRLDIAYPAVSGHPDMLFHQLDENCAAVVPAALEYFKEMFPDCEIFAGGAIADTYPGDIAYNIARLGKLAFHNKKYTDKKIYEYYARNGIRLINTAQGYTKCSICIVSENAIITADRKLARLAGGNGLDALLIGSGNIRLKDFPYGFIGGAAGLISKEILAFNGDITQHPDYRKIKHFCARHGVETLPLHSDVLEDIGSIIPVK